MDKEDLFAGAVFPNSPPQRNKSSKYGINKWFITVDEYEYNLFPPFINAGAYIMSRHTMKRIYLASHFVKMFRFDDVYLGIVAKKCGITLMTLCCEKFYKQYELIRKKSGMNLKSVIAAHLYFEREKLEDIWLQQVKLGNA